MWSVTPRFLDSIGVGHRLVTTATLICTGLPTSQLTLSAGTVTTDRTQRIRRVAAIDVQGGSTLFDQLATPGARVSITHGFGWSGTDQELVPMIVGELSSAAKQLSSGLIRVQIADFWQILASSDYLAPYTPATTAVRTAEIIAAVQAAIPGGVTVRNTASDTGTVGTQQAWTSRSDYIASLAADGGMDVYFAPDGAFVMRDSAALTDPTAWTIKTGPGGTLSDLTRTRPLGQVYNTVILTPATSDATQAWTQVVAQITDTTSPLHPNNIGVRPFRYQSPTALTTDGAQAIAERVLFKVQGSTETLSLDAISNPALEAGDIVRVLTPIDGGNTIVSHFLDSADTDLMSGAMSCATRASNPVTGS